MKLNFTVDMNDLYGEDGIDFEDLLSDSLKREIVKSSKDHIACDQFKEFSRITIDATIAQIKLKLENFLSEEIALTDKWGKPTFVGSIEDLMKKQFDDILLRPVDSSGKTIHGCTTSDAAGNTWIEWMLKKHVDDSVYSYIKEAANRIGRIVSDEVDKKIIELKDQMIKQQVNDAFTSILKK